MKKIITLLFAVALTSAAIAQNFAHVNSQELLAAMPETQQMQIALENKGKEYEGQIQGMAAEYQTKLQEFQSTGENLSEAIREVKIKEIQDLEVRIQQLQQSAQQDLVRMEEELTQPILEKARAAIKTVATERGYEYVFDLASGAIVHFPEGRDITASVKSKLGI